MELTAIAVAAGYIVLLLFLSRLGGGSDQSNDTFYSGGHRSPWYAVAFGMVGASLSGVSFVSVPGWVQSTQMTYLQTCMGFIVGYLVVALVLLPVYYRGGYTSIYGYLSDRFSAGAYRTGATMFVVSKMAGAAVRLYLTCLILQRFVFQHWHVPFALSAAVVMLVIWLYTRRSGIRTIVWTDCLQTAILLLSLILIMCNVCAALGYSAGEAWNHISQSPMSRVFVWDDWMSRQNFWKQFVSGVFIVIVMTGLDQDMMQKNLTCKTLRQSQKGMSIYGLLFLPVNLLFLSLGILLVEYARQAGVQLPQVGDEILPTLCAGGYFGQVTLVLFTVGIVAAAFSSADSALTALTTTCCVDIMGRPHDERLRRRMHPMVALAMLGMVMVIYWMGSSSVIDAVYTIASYTYGPLLGLFAFGLATRLQPSARMVPVVCVGSIVLTWCISRAALSWWGYTFGYELLMLNGMITFVGLTLCAGTRRTR